MKRSWKNRWGRVGVSVKGALAALAIVPWLLLFGVTARAGEIGFLEEFALSADREAALKKLIPGTEDYYFFHCLHYQTTEQFDRAAEMLAAWQKRHPNSKHLKQMQRRQALLTYSRDPQATFEFLRRELQLRFDHQPPRGVREVRLPHRLDPKLIARETLTQQALTRQSGLSGFEDTALDWLAQLNLDGARRHQLLQRLTRPDSEALVDLVLADLKSRYNSGFGSLKIHRHLLKPQLDVLRMRLPELLSDRNFVGVYLQKLAPPDDVDWTADADAHREYLDRLWSFVVQLPPVHNSLKANVLYHRLQFDRTQGVYDKRRFLDYIKLPRQAPYVNRGFLAEPEQRRHLVDLNARFAELPLPPIRQDDPLIREYLLHFFVGATDYDEFRPYLDETYLRKLFAEAKLVNGLGDAERWYAYLSPEELQALRERVDIEFAPENPRRFDPDDEVAIDVYLKNASPLIVKVFQIDTLRHYQRSRKPLDTSINLDGLVPNSERVIKLDEPPIRRVRRRLSFPEMKGPGVWVVDLIGGGKSSRALIRKGTLSYVVRDGAAGHVFTVLDHAGRKLSDARLWLDGRFFEPEQDGRIIVPFSARPGPQPIVLVHRDFAVLTQFDHHGEQYELAAGFAVNRESLLPNRQARLALRASVLLNGVPVAPEVLQDVSLTILAVNDEGVQTSRLVRDVKLRQDAETIVPFRVPSALRQLRFVLQAKVKSLTTGREQTLTAGQAFEVNGIAATDQIADVHLLVTPEGYDLAVLGHNGEPRAWIPVQIRLKHRDFRQPVTVKLQADERGRIHLGTLPDIVRLHASPERGKEKTWNLDQRDAVLPSVLQLAARQAVRLPLPTEGTNVVRSDMALLERRGSTYVADRFDRLTQQGRACTIGGLEGGSYELHFKRLGIVIPIRVTDGPVTDGFVIGRSWRLQVSQLPGAWDLRVSTADDALEVRFDGARTSARVHVVASKFFPVFSFADLLRAVPDPTLTRFEWAPTPSAYVTGRAIGDEYEYILRRRYEGGRIGNMLRRPGLLLNPWAVRETSTGRQEARAGGAFAAKGGKSKAKSEASPTKRFGIPTLQDFADLGFLAESAPAVLNLRPGERGHVRLSRADLGTRHCVEVVVVHPGSVLRRRVVLPEQPTPLHDRRLRVGLDPKRHFMQSEVWRALKAGDSVQIGDVTASRFALYDSVAAVRGLLAAMVPDAAWNTFAFVDRWDELDAAERLELYSRHACHELNVFLAFKDPAFFREVVLPYLQQKYQPTFVDRWLTGADLTGYFEGYRYDRLNVAERVLLARRADAAAAAAVRRQLAEAWELVPPDPRREHILFEAALQGRSLERGAPGLEEAAAAGVRFNRLLEKQADGRVMLDEEIRDSLSRFAIKERPNGGFAPADLLKPMAGPPGAKSRRLAAGREAKRAADRNGNGVVEMETEALRRAAERELAERQRDRTAELAVRGRAQRFYRPMEKTREWAESNYYRRRLADEWSEMIPVSRFWLEAAKGSDIEPVLAPSVIEATRNFHEAMLALALLDVPFQPAEHRFEYSGSDLKITAGSNALVYYEEIQPLPVRRGEAPILVTQNFFAQKDRYHFVRGERVEKFVTREFLTHTVYGGSVVVSNPTARTRRLTVLYQVPLGAIPLRDGRHTRAVPLSLEPFATVTLEYYFYFPKAGDFVQFPAHVGEEDAIVAFAEPRTFHVVDEPTVHDRDSWPFVAQHGSDDEVLQYLRTHNVFALDLYRIAFRLRNKAFFQRLVALLRERHRFDQIAFSYGIFHGDPQTTREFLQRQRWFISSVGTVLESPLLTVEPFEERFYEFLEYEPLVNARAHQLGRRRQILNEAFFEQYQRLLDIVSRRREPTADERLALTYYMLLQDRIDEAREQFGHVDRKHVRSKLQYDYARAYLAMFSPQTAPLAGEIARQYADHPVVRWRERFRAILGQLQELERPGESFADSSNPLDVNTELARTQPALDVEVEGTTIRLTYQNLDHVDVRYYAMDIELLFSRSPFVQKYADLVASVKPNVRQRIDLPREAGEFTFELPETLKNRNVLVQVAGGGLVRTVASYAHTLAVQFFETAGQVRVIDRGTGRPIAGAYVKVYARSSSGRVRFYKDGYTDLRGRFDYVALSTDDLDDVERFAVLVLTDRHGAVVREVEPPKR
ncbi:MAG: hypothetical protein D6725_16950 [Planctomycetota bacterium]|nr:MAG: hypothetical protein D6725_16950 [Planctomycetota bacterium]